MKNHEYQTAETEDAEYESRWDNDEPRKPSRRELQEQNEQYEQQDEKPVRKKKKIPQFNFGEGTNHEPIWLALYLVLLLLAPLMQEGIEFTFAGQSFYMSAYWPLLVCAVPILIAAVLLKPTNLLFFVFAPLLPVAAYFTLQNAAEHLWLLFFVLVGICGLPIYHVIHTSKQPKDDEDDDPEQRGSKREYGRGMLTFGVIFMTAALLIPAVLGYALPETYDPIEVPDPATMGLEVVITNLSKQWPESYENRDKILQSLLAWECISEHPQHKNHICSIEDAKIKAVTKKGKRAVKAARRTKEEDLQKRVELMCYVAQVQKLRKWNAETETWGSITNNTRNDAANYAKNRAKFYVEQIQIEE